MYSGKIYLSGGLLQWLECKPKPDGWVTIRPLCFKLQDEIGFPILRLPGQELLQYPLPGKRIIIVENLESGLSLPSLPNTLVICGQGNNLSWMQANWLKVRNVYYWGDIDSHGLKMLALARSYVPSILAILMDQKTLMSHTDSMVMEISPTKEPEQGLTSSEKELFKLLQSGKLPGDRLEQERIKSCVINRALKAIITSSI